MVISETKTPVFRPEQIEKTEEIQETDSMPNRYVSTVCSGKNPLSCIRKEEEQYLEKTFGQAYLDVSYFPTFSLPKKKKPISDFAPIVTELSQGTLGTLGLSGRAQTPAVPDHLM
jgi:hypothetical protein